MIDKGIARHAYEVLDARGSIIGRVTSGTISPMLKTGIALAYVETAFAQPGTEVFVRVRNRELKAGVVKLPFRR